MSLSYPHTVVSLEKLERRALFAAVFPTAGEQLIVELINRGRADPAAEAARYGIPLNEGVPTGSIISTDPKQPLAINPNLTDAARDHSQWMIDNDVFNHTGGGGSTPHSRMVSAGYTFTGDWTSGENLAWRGSNGSIDVNAETAQLHADLFIDEGVDGRGHRTNQMNGDYREVGVGVITGAFTYNGTTYTNSVMGSEDFAKSGTSVFLTGVAYNDGVTDDNFYTVGEALAGVTISAVRAGDNATFDTTTWASGGYRLALPAGTYTVTGSGGSLGGTVVHGSVVIGSVNVKRDFRPDLVAADFAELDNGALTVNGTGGNDAVALSVSGATLTATRNGISQMFTASSVTSIQVLLGAGADSLTVGAGIGAVYADGGEGDDHLIGGAGNDTLTGGAGKDKVFGGLGDDRLNGNGGHDKLFGEEGKDRLYGGLGYDTLDGGAHVDRIWGDGGLDTLFGQGGNDLLYALDGEADFLAGGSGADTAQRDVNDLLASVETIV
ncbi:MAG: CAP domain-containing protein [Tepidisphaeraceae bacterium]